MTNTTSPIVTDLIPEPLRPVMEAICGVSVDVARIIARGPLGEALGAQVGAANADGDDQKALDVIADEMFAAALMKTSTRFWASEERDEVIELNPEGKYVVAMDPLDGSSNIDVNVSIGSIFSIYDAKETGEASVLRPASEQIGGGYVIYGPQTGLVVTFGDGTQHYILDPDSKRFELAEERMSIPTQSSEFAINASNYRHWTKPVRAFIDDCIAGSEGPRGRNFNMRWVASLVAETHRIITRGGVFLYPSDGRDGYQHGRLRMLYECAPIAFVVEQAGGRATDGCDPIMGKGAEHLHQRTPFVFGSAEKVARVATYHDLPEDEVSALFGRRGLFRD
ncbi:MAG: class 1 fructose-bisphosphatase [Rhodobacteraceae bacterium]|nr:class 1 fructose-bisphosphatase [Paracoccaceae bacterium]